MPDKKIITINVDRDDANSDWLHTMAKKRAEEEKKKVEKALYPPQEQVPGEMHDEIPEAKKQKEMTFQHHDEQDPIIGKQLVMDLERLIEKYENK